MDRSARSLAALLVVLVAAAERPRGESGPADAPGPAGQRGGGPLGRLAGSVSNAVLAGVDPDVLVRRLDVNALLDRVDPDALLDRVDPDALLDRVDVDRLLERVDVNRLLDRVDVDRLVQRIDVDRLLADTDVEALVRRAGIPEIVAESTGHMAGSVIDLVRQQAVALDVIVMRALLRLTGRDPDRLPAGPSGLVGDATGQIQPPDPQAAPGRADYEVTGHYAGLLSRGAAMAGDVFAASSSYTAVSAGVVYVLNGVFGLGAGTPAQSGPAWVVLLAAWCFVYWFVSTAVAGRTPAMALLGLRIVSRDGTPLRTRSSLVRVVSLPLSTLPLGIGFVGIVLDRERRALHDLLASSTVVYDWGRRSARLPTPLGRWMSQHGAGAAQPGDGGT